MSQVNQVDAPSHQFSSRKWFAVVFVVTLTVRSGVLICLPHGLSQDTDAYRRLAETLRATGTLGFQTPATDLPLERLVSPTAFRPPLYPLLLSGLVTHGKLSIVAAGIFHLVCGVATVTIVWRIARSWDLERFAAVPAMLVACDPILLYQSTQLMTETLATLLAVSALWGLTRWWRRPTGTTALFAGLLLGLACLCRPTFLPWSGLILGSCLVGNLAIGMRIRAATLLLAGLLAALFPWGMRNYLQFGQFKLTTTHGGYTLLLGNNPNCYRFLREQPWGSVWDSRELDEAWLRRNRLRNAEDDLFALAPLQAARDSTPSATIVRNELEDDRLAYDLAKRYCREDPATFVYSCLHRIVSLWQVLPHRLHDFESPGRQLFRWLTAGWYLMIYGWAAVGAWQLKRRLFAPPWLWGILLCLTFTMVHSLYWSNMRMRAPLMPFVALLAAAGLAAAIDRNRSGRSLES